MSADASVICFARWREFCYLRALRTIEEVRAGFAWLYTFFDFFFFLKSFTLVIWFLTKRGALGVFSKFMAHGGEQMCLVSVLVRSRFRHALGGWGEFLS